MIIIDDGFHRFDANINFLEIRDSLNDGDIIVRMLEGSQELLKNFIPAYQRLTSSFNLLI